MKTYRITSGTFDLGDGTYAHAGDTIQLEDDVARLHAARLQLDEPPAQADEPAKADQPAA